MVRGNLARAYLHKYRFDWEHQQLDLSEWYSLGEDCSEGSLLAASFRQLAFDADTAAFLDASKAQSDNVCLQIWFVMLISSLSQTFKEVLMSGTMWRCGSCRGGCRRRR